MVFAVVIDDALTFPLGECRAITEARDCVLPGTPYDGGGGLGAVQRAALASG